MASVVRAAPVRWRGGIVYVDVYVDIHGTGWRQRLQGMDHYWWTEDAFGMFNSTDQYEGRSAVFYRVTDAGVVDEGTKLPPPGTTIFDGIMLPDHLAREHGLL